MVDGQTKHGGGDCAGGTPAPGAEPSGRAADGGRADPLYESPCGYFDGVTAQAEIYLFPSPRLAAALTGRHPHAQKKAFDSFLALGFRRSGCLVYRETCPACQKCVPIRIRTARFAPTKSQRAVLKKNADVSISITANPADFVTDEKIALMKTYNRRHDPHSSMDAAEIRRQLADMNGLLDESARPLGAPVFPGVLNMEYRLSGRLIGCGIVDAGVRSLSSNYFYYDTAPEVLARSIGTYSILKEIEYCLAHDLPLYYLGYYIADCRKMNYKAHFRPHELRDASSGEWRTARTLPGAPGGA